MYCISVRSFLFQVPPWHQKLLGKDGSKMSSLLYLCFLFTSPGSASVIYGCYLCYLCTVDVSQHTCFCCFSGTAFKTQKEVVKAIFVNNIERLGHHYARVFDESWWISSPVSGSLNVNKCIVTDSEVCFVFVCTYLDQLLYGTDFFLFKSIGKLKQFNRSGFLVVNSSIVSSDAITVSMNAFHSTN